MNNDSKDSKLALLSFHGDSKDQIITHLRKNYLQTGTYVNNGGSISKNTILPVILGGAGALGVSSAMSGSLFIATANPATLMAVGGGVTSAVVGAGGKIISQAPFVSAAGAILPVIAPLIAFQALISISMARNFDAINKRLDKIEGSISRLLHRTEAIYIGEMISAQSRLKNIEDRLSETGQFTNHMQMRLSLVEHSINPIFEKYKYLLDGQEVKQDMTSDDLAYRNLDAFMAINTSILDLKLDVLRLKLTYQENPAFIQQSTKNLLKKIERYKGLWLEINSSITDAGHIHDDISSAIEEFTFFQRNISKRGEYKNNLSAKKIFKKNGRNKDLTNKMIEGAESIATNISDALSKDENDDLAIVYWKDEVGEHCYYTNELVISK